MCLSYDSIRVVHNVIYTFDFRTFLPDYTNLRILPDNTNIRMYEQSSELMNRGGFRLRKWHTNSEALRAKINVTVNNPENAVNAETVSGKPDDVVESATPGSKHEPDENLKSLVNSVKVLVVSWNDKTDTLQQEHSDLVKFPKRCPLRKDQFLSCLRRFSTLYRFNNTPYYPYESTVSSDVFVQLRLG